MKNIININNTIGGSKITTLLVPSTSTDEAVVRWDGTSGKSIQNSSVTIDDDGNQKTTNSLTLLTNDANPNGDETLWVNSLDSNKLYFGENKVGDVTSNTTPSINNSLVLFDGLTGKIIKESSIINNIGGINNVRLQSGGQSISYGNNQLILGFNSYSSEASSDDANVVLGNQIFNTNNEGSFDRNTIIGNSALGNSSVAIERVMTQNTIIGSNCCNNLTATTADVNNNIVIGYDSGISYLDGESGNIILFNSGVVGDQNTTRIGNVQSRCFIAGIKDVIPLGTNEMVIIDENNQLGSQPIPTGDVVGAVSSTDNAVVRWDGTTGKLIQNTTGFTCDDNFNVKIGDTTSDVNRILHIQSKQDASIFIESDTDELTESDNPQLVLTQDGNSIYSSFGLEDDGGEPGIRNNLVITTARDNEFNLVSIIFKTGGLYAPTATGTIPSIITPPISAMRIRGIDQNVEINKTLLVDNLVEFTLDAGVTIEETRFENGGINLTTKTTNPEGANTRWQRTSDGHLFRGAVDLENPYGVSVIKPNASIAQPMVTSPMETDLIGTWNTFISDSNVTNTDAVFTIVNTGRYKYTLNLFLNASVPRNTGITIYVNAVATEYLFLEMINNIQTYNVSHILNLNATDTIKCAIYWRVAGGGATCSIDTRSNITIERVL